MHRTLFAGPFLCALGLSVLMAHPIADVDVASIPPDPVKVTAELKALEHTLVQAVEIAVKDVEGGAPHAARALLGSAEPAFEIEVYSPQFLSRILVDAHTGKISKRTDIPRLPGDPVSGDWVELPSGLKYYELKQGSGPSPAGPKAVVRVHFSSWVIDGTPIESTLERGEPLEAPLKKVLKGVAEGVQGMKVGGKRKLIFPWDLGYGMGGKPPSVPPKATIVFDVELLALL